MSMNVIVVGGGRVGGYLASLLLSAGDKVKIIEERPGGNRSLVVTSLARFEFSVPRTIARVKDPRNAWMFTPEMGVDVALNQADLLAHLVAEEMSLGDMMTLLKLRKGLFSLVEEKVHPVAAAAGKALRDLKLPDKCVLAAVLRKSELIVPHGDLVLRPADEVVALVQASQVTRLAAILGGMKEPG